MVCANVPKYGKKPVISPRRGSKRVKKAYILRIERVWVTVTGVIIDPYG